MLWEAKVSYNSVSSIMKLNTQRFKILSKINHSYRRSYVCEATFNTRDFKVSPNLFVSYDSQSKQQVVPYTALTIKRLTATLVVVPHR
jgi:hypothetical protein